MDANNNKTLAVAFVALLVGSAFVAMAPTAAAQLFTAGPDQDVIINADVRESVTFNGTTVATQVSPVASPADTKLRYNSTYDIRVININVDPAGSGYGYIGSTSTAVYLVNSTGVIIATGQLIQNGTSTLYNATFIGVKLGAVGVYQVRSVETSEIAANLFVYPADDLTVTITPNTQAYQTEGILFTVSVTQGGNPVPDALIWSTAGPTFIPGVARTNSVGQYQFFAAPPGAGTFNISAARELAAPTTLPEQFSNTTLTVSGLTLTLTGANTTANVGFSQVVSFVPRYSDNSLVFGASPPVTPSNINITLANGSLRFYANASFPGSSGNLAVTCADTSTGGVGAGLCTSNSVPTIHVNRVSGYLTITPNTAWSAGTYTVSLALNSVGAADTSPEYTGSTTFAPATPAAVNLQVSPVTVDVPVASNPGASNSAIGTTTLTLTVNGATQTEFPTDSTSGWDAFDATRNVTLTGDVLPGYSVANNTLGDGIYVITLTPTRNGTVTVNVAWKNTTTTITVPVANGAVLTTTTTNMTVDETASVTVNVKNAFGGAVENALVYVMKRGGGAFSGTGTTAITGTGAPNVGQGGNYVFTLKPDAVQDLVFYAIVASNYSYAPVSVQPSQNLTVTITNGTVALNGTMAALRTPALINATNGTASLVSTAANFEAHLLTAAQVRNLQNNGTTAFTGTGSDAILTANKLAVDSAGAAGMWTNITQTAANDYWLYVCASTTSISSCASAKYDNRQNLVLFNVSRYTATFTPTQIPASSDIGANQTVQVMVKDKAGNPANGSIRFLGGAATNIRSDLSPGALNSTSGTTVTNGIANFTLTGVGAIGNVSFEFNPTEASGTQTTAWGLVDGNLSISAGNITYTPAKVPILQSTLVTVNIQNFTGAGLPGRVIRICGVGLNPNFPASFPTQLDTASRANCTSTDVTQADGSAGIVVSPNSLQPLGIYVNDSYTGKTIPVIAGSLTVTVSPAAPRVGDTVTLTASQANQPSAGISISVTRDGAYILNQTTDSQGRVVLSNVTAGNYSVLAVRSGFENGTATFTVGGAATNGTQFRLSNLVVPDRVNVGQAITVSADIENLGATDGTANAILLVNNAQRGTQSVFVAGNDKETVAFDFTPTVAGTYQVTIRLQTGETLANKTVTVGTPTTPVTTTTTTPVTTTTSPTSGGTPTTTTTTVSPTPTTEPTPRVPGFEVVALVAALGVALLVLRRRS